MSSAPSGWQDPKTNWNSADVPLPTDFNRIEGNIQSIESGSRTLDPSQAPTGNTGSLRQLLDWFANRLKAITGAVNWYDSPVITLAGAKQGLDSIQSALDTHKSSGDHDGRYYTKSQLNTSGGGGQVHWNNVTSKPSIPSNPVPVSQLKKAQASYSPTDWQQTFAVHQYAFGSPNLSFNGRRWSHMPLRLNTEAGLEVVPILAVQDTARAQTITWDYLTASGHPRVWAEVDGRGEIVSIWEAEDPADQEWPDEPPFEPEESLVLIQVEPPDEKLLEAVAERLERAPMPQGFTRSIYAADQPARAVRAMFARQLQERGLEEPPDIRDVLSISDRDRKYWYMQLYMRQASRLLHDHRASTLIPLYREMCRVDRRTGRLMLR